MNNKEQRIMNDLNHKLSNEIINIAKKNKANISMENLKNIRQTAKNNKNFRYFLNSWHREIFNFLAQPEGHIAVSYIT